MISWGVSMANTGFILFDCFCWKISAVKFILLLLLLSLSLFLSYLVVVYEGHVFQQILKLVPWMAGPCPVRKKKRLKFITTLGLQLPAKRPNDVWNLQSIFRTLWSFLRQDVARSRVKSCRPTKPTFLGCCFCCKIRAWGFEVLEILWMVKWPTYYIYSDNLT